MDGVYQTTYELIPGYFVHDTTDPRTIEAILPRFGLLSDPWDSWGAFFNNLENLNNEAICGTEITTTYKLIFLTRHGEALHNRELRNWKPGDKETTGIDPELTEDGKEQARYMNKAWKTELMAGLRVPGQFYTSPLTRGLQTCSISFDGIFPERKFPIIIENCRERYGMYLSSMRKTLVQIQESFPNKFMFESDFQNEDLLWQKERESKENIVHRAREVLDVVFAGEELFVSVTTHWQVINGIRVVMGLGLTKIPTGGVYPMVVKAIRRFHNAASSTAGLHAE